MADDLPAGCSSSLSSPRGLPTVEGQEFVVEQRTLPNGLRVWVSPLEAAETVQVRLVVLAGKLHALPRPPQTAHLLEHLLLLSRKGGSAVDLNQEVRKRNSSLNGVTLELATCYQAYGPPAQLPFLGRLLRELVFENSLEGKDLAGERHVVIAELGGLPSWVSRLWGGIQGPDIWQKVNRDLFQETPPCYHAELSALQIAKVSRRDMTDFHQRYYTPDESVLIIVGPVDVQEALGLAASTYGDVRARRTERRHFEEPPQPGHFVRVEHRGLRFFGVSGRAYCGARLDQCSHRQLYAYMILRNLIRERLHDELREKERLTYAVDARISSVGDYGVIWSSASQREGLVDEVAERVKAEYLKVGRNGVTAGELERLQKGLLIDHRVTFGRAFDRANWLTFFAIGPQGRGGDPLDPLAIIESLTLKEVNDIAREISREDNMFIATSRPLLNVRQSTLALIIIVAVFVGLVVLAVRWRRRARKAAAKAAQS